ncbi:uncharacterized protein [Miscanthus floridulus]|uniref:uncharacterized protein n=1 Tax=Miscanthus floridulus TaxID=154761 RepID=UPI0034585208
MAQKSLYEYSIPTIANVPVRPVVNTSNNNFELRTGLITMVQANPFCGLLSEDANAHLQHFLELCDTIIIKDITLENIRLCLFPFSLVGKAKQWFYKDKEAVNTWAKCSMAFLAKFFPMGKTIALKGRIQISSRIPWNLFRRDHIDATATGAFLSLTINGAMTLIKKMVSNQWWGDERLRDEQQKGIHTMKEMDMLVAKIDLLIKRLNERAQKKEAIYGTVKAMDLHMTCEVYGESGHSWNNCPETHEDDAYINRSVVGTSPIVFALKK